ncbi:MAG: ABC transporter ATP-binding protein [Rhodobacteraceae bacterium]|nr:ABC transporter ATP-binding protein [Paracoccaceae bacterium]
MATILALKGVAMHYNAGSPAAVAALDGVDLDLEGGRALGVVGESGCGKSSLALTIMQTLPRRARIVGGSISLEGRDLVGLPEAELEAMRWTRISMIFQGAMNALNPVQTIGRQLIEPALRTRAQRLGQEAAKARALDLLRRVDLTDEIYRRFPHELSGGMKQRAIIAMSLMCNPAIIIADEPTTALDVVAQDRVLAQLDQIRAALGTSVILISHDIAVIVETCDTIAVMYGGQIIEAGDIREVFARPRHPYTRMLFGSVPSLRGARKPLAGIGGEPPDLMRPPPGCRFAPRCEFRIPACTAAAVPEVAVSGRHRVRCIRFEEAWPPLHDVPGGTALDSVRPER